MAVAAVIAGGSVAAASFTGDGKETLNLGAVDSALAIDVQKDRRLVVAGSTSVGGDFDFAVARFEADGDVDNTFSGNGFEVTPFDGFDGGDDLAIQRNGRIVLVGRSDLGPDGAFAAARYVTGGTLDSSFSDDGKVTTPFSEPSGAEGVALQRDRRIVAVGQTGSDFALARYRPNGNLDQSFAGDGRQTTSLAKFDTAEAVAIQRDGKIVVAGSSCRGPGMSCEDNVSLARYKPNGRLDRSFSRDGKTRPNLGGGDSARDVAIQRDGRIVVVGAASPGPQIDSDVLVARFKPNGKLDRSFSRDGRAYVDFGDSDLANAVTIHPRGQIIAVGSTQATPTVDSVIVRFRPNGKLDKSFSDDGRLTADIASGNGDTAQDVVLQTRRKIVITGGIAPSNDFYVARFRNNGAIDD
jgi:uncharacterized delta-60 repeat protein